MESNNKKSLRNTLNLFLIIFIAIGAIVSGLASAFYRSEVDSIFNTMKMQEKLTVTLQNKIIGEYFSSTISDLFFLARQNEIIDYLNISDPRLLRAIESEYIEMSKQKKIYDQLRFLDSLGKEQVRVNFRNGDVAAVSIDKLQDKSKRYYFSDAIKIDREEIFVSPLDLNIENGEIEVPYKPMIRFATPVFDFHGNKTGIILINYLAEKLLNDIKRAGEISIGSVMLINTNGYWLLNQENPAFEWGFMFPDDKKHNFPNLYQKEWSIIQNTKSGQFETNNGLFTYEIVFPLSETVAGTSSEYSWVLVSRISSNLIDNYKRKLLINLFLFGAGLFVFIALGSWFTAFSIIRRKVHRLELVEMATRDALTSLPNRRMCFERLKSSVDHARRFNRKLGILYIDLDGFKEINDTKGHSAGDELLIKVSETLTSISRSSDIVARLGGDEFVCILTEIDSCKGAIHAGNKVIDALNSPIILRSGRAFVGASVGVSIYPDHDTNYEELLIKADRAMYESKARGKNVCTIYQDSF